MDRAEDSRTFAGRARSFPTARTRGTRTASRWRSLGPNPDDAVKVLKRAAQLSPDLGYEKFMFLGQLLDDGEAAATCTRRGLALIEYQAAHGDEDASERMCGACCALAEQLMAIAEDVDDVADECDALLKRAAEADRASAEPLQVLASLRVLQGRNDEALEALRQSMAIWRAKKGTAGGGTGGVSGDGV